MKTAWVVTPVCSVAACLLAACSGGIKGGADAAADVPVEAAGDLADVPAEVAEDAAPDAAADAPVEVAPPDTGPDTAIDAPADTATDTAEPETTDVPPAETCAVLPPLQPFSLEPSGGEGPGGDTVVSGDATVTYKGPSPLGGGCGGSPCQQVSLRMDDGAEHVLTYALPEALEVPVYAGQRVHVYWKRSQPWWVDAVLVLWKGTWDHDPIFLMHDAARGDSSWFDCGGRTPCPTLAQVETACPPTEAECGAFTHPPVGIELLPGSAAIIGQGETAVDQAPDRRVRFLVAHSRVAERMDCADYPGTWVSVAAMRHADVSQCRCRDNADCRPGEVCAPDIGRCVTDRCRPDAPCGPPGYCDAYTGECVEEAEPCATDADCGLDRVCNPNLVPCTWGAGCVHPPQSGCVKNLCVVADCAPGTTCSALMSSCVKCAADCDCPDYGAGGWCDEREPGGTCRTCDTSRVAFGQPDVFDFFTVCASSSSLDEGVLKAIDPGVDCKWGNASVWKCDPATEVLCRSDIPTTMKEHGLSDEAWARACAFAAVPWVTRVGGGFWE